MTEMCGFATIEPIRSSDLETSGVPVPGVSIKIVDPDTRAVLGPNRVGEIHIKSSQLFTGYLNSDLLDDDIVSGVDSDGWFATSDIGYYDHNRKLQIVDPCNDFVQTRGLYISPTSLEAILLSHFAVKEVAIFGTSRGKCEQNLIALVVLKTNINNNYECDDTSEKTSDVLKDYINGKAIGGIGENQLILILV